VAEPKDKKAVGKARPTRRDGVEKFDPFWNGKAGRVATEAEYVRLATSERPGFHRGARVR
jgi:hypothetical protein